LPAQSAWHSPHLLSSCYPARHWRALQAVVRGWLQYFCSKSKIDHGIAISIEMRGAGRFASSRSRHIFEVKLIRNRVGGPFMLNQLRKQRGFGVGDKPRCLNCGELTSLTRRAPATEFVLEYEEQTFTCFGCEREFRRVVDARGRRVPASAFS
jgi:hypothetical protein